MFLSKILIISLYLQYDCIILKNENKLIFQLNN